MIPDSRFQIPDSKLLARNIAPPRPDAIVAVRDFDADRMPAAVFLRRRRIPEIVLFAQLVGDVLGRRVQVASRADDLGAAAAVVGHVPQRDDVHAIVAGSPASRPAAARTTTADRRPASSPAAAPRRKWKRNRPTR